MQYTSPVCSIDIAPGWTPAEPISQQDGSDAIAFAPLGDDALLTLTTFDPAVSRTDARTWVELVAKVNRQKNRHVTRTHVGEFAGYYMWFETDSIHMRAWAMLCGDQPLDVTYRCDVSIAGRDDALVDTMLATTQRSSKMTE